MVLISQQEKTVMDVDPKLEPMFKAIQAMSPQSREMLLTIVRQMAEREGINVPLTAAQGLQTPSEGIPLWIAKLRAEKGSERTIHMYEYLVSRFLKDHPAPTKFEIQKYLAMRLAGVSAASASNEKKALASFFKFLQEEGLWISNPMSGIGHIKVKYSDKQPPSTEDVMKVLNGKILRKRDADKYRLLILLLLTTGLRITEAVGIRKGNVNMESLEARVIGKGDKPRVVPLLSATAKALQNYIAEYPSDSPYLFPGKTKTGYASIHNVEKTFKRACKRAGIKPFTPHQLRHAFATEMLKAGAKLEIVSRILGHAGVGVTADVYRHVQTQELHETAERFAPRPPERGGLLGEGKSSKENTEGD
ncbi:tyrosine-type recombinase/integrase [Chloroflexota bacterium]